MARIEKITPLRISIWLPRTEADRATRLLHSLLCLAGPRRQNLYEVFVRRSVMVW